MNEIVTYGSLIAGLFFAINGLRWRRDGGSVLIPMGVVFALIGVSRLIGPKFMPVMLVAFVAIVIGVGVRFYSMGPERRARMRAVTGLAFAVFAVIGAMVIFGYAGIHGTPLLILAGMLGVLGAAFIVVAMVRLAKDVRANPER